MRTHSDVTVVEQQRDDKGGILHAYGSLERKTLRDRFAVGHLLRRRDHLAKTVDANLPSDGFLCNTQRHHAYATVLFNQFFLYWRNGAL